MFIWNKEESREVSPSEPSPRYRQVSTLLSQSSHSATNDDLDTGRFLDSHQVQFQEKKGFDFLWSRTKTVSVPSGL